MGSWLQQLRSAKREYHDVPWKVGSVHGGQCSGWRQKGHNSPYRDRTQDVGDPKESAKPHVAPGTVARCAGGSSQVTLWSKAVCNCRTFLVLSIKSERERVCHGFRRDLRQLMIRCEFGDFLPQALIRVEESAEVRAAPRYYMQVSTEYPLLMCEGVKAGPQYDTKQCAVLRRLCIDACRNATRC